MSESKGLDGVTFPLKYRMLIGGEEVESASKRTREIKDPANGKIIAIVPEGNDVDAKAAICAARKAFNQEKGWSRWNVGDRRKAIEKFASLIMEKVDYLARLEVLENGKPLGEAMFDITASADLFKQYANWMETMMGEIVPLGIDDHKGYVEYEPIGVCAAITPWNYPLFMTACKFIYNYTGY